MASDSQSIQVETIEDDAIRRTLVIDVPEPRVRKAFERIFRDLGKQARVKGFRPGKVPRSVIQKMYGGTIGEEVERLLVGQTLEEAIEQSAVQPVVEPTIDAGTPVEGEAFRYKVGLEVKPEIQLGDLQGLPATRPRVEVGDQELERELDSLRERHAALVEEPEDTVAARGHTVTIDFVGRVGEVAFEGGTAQGHELELGAGRFVPGFEEQLEGVRAGEDRQVTITFPEDYGNEELSGKEAVFDVHVVSIQRRELPDLDDEFAKDVGEFETMAELRDRTRNDLEEAATRRARTAVEKSVMDALIERTPFELGPGLVERQLQGRLSGAHQQLQNSVPHEALHEQLSRWQEEWRPQAEREVREALLLEAVARERGLEVDDEEIAAKIEEVAGQQGVDPKQVRKAYEERDLMSGLRGQLLDEKALAWLCDEAKVEEVSDS